MLSTKEQSFDTRWIFFERHGEIYIRVLFNQKIYFRV